MRLSPSTLRNWGIGLLIVSFLVPDLGVSGNVKPCAGTLICISSGISLFHGLFRPASEWNLVEVARTIALVLAFFSNFTVFFRVPHRWAWVPIVAPWFAFGYLPAVGAFIPFYPWAIGIGLIHASRYFEQPAGQPHPEPAKS
jgi:hypothetical protein